MVSFGYRDLLNNKPRPGIPRRIRHLLGFPLLISFLFILPIFDLWSEIYHRVCFLLYGIDYINRGKYIKIDRHKLNKLSTFEKFGCIYCGYINGYMLYAGAIAQATEKYWCGIMHKQNDHYKLPEYQKSFASRTQYE